METTELNKTKEEVVEAFRMMWGNYPSPVMLITYGHEIVAVNDTCAALGTPLGVKCFSLGGDHSGCKAGAAKKSGKAVRHVAYAADRGVVYDGYWLPVCGEYLVHLGNDITAFSDIERFKNEAD